MAYSRKATAVRPKNAMWRENTDASFYIPKLEVLMEDGTIHEDFLVFDKLEDKPVGVLVDDNRVVLL